MKMEFSQQDFANFAEGFAGIAGWKGLQPLISRNFTYSCTRRAELPSCVSWVQFGKTICRNVSTR